MLLTFLAKTVDVYCACMGNVASPEIPEKGLFLPPDEAVGAKVGYVGDYVFKSRYKIEHFDKGEKIKIGNVRSQRQLGELVFNVLDRVEAYGRLGVMKIHTLSLSDRVLKFSLSPETAFNWEAGGRATIIHWNDTVFGLDAKYTQSHLSKTQLKQWQIGGEVVQHFRYFIPYAGFSIFNSRLWLHDILLPSFIGNVEIKNKNRVILFLGASVTTDSYFFLTIEGRFFGETGFSFFAEVKF